MVPNATTVSCDATADALRDAERRGWLLCRPGLGHEELSRLRLAWTERCHWGRAVAVEAVVFGGQAWLRWWLPPGLLLPPEALSQLALILAGADRGGTLALHRANGYVGIDPADAELLGASVYDALQEHVGPAAAGGAATR